MIRLRTLSILTRFYLRYCFVSLAVSCCFIYGVLLFGLKPLAIWLPFKMMVSALTIYFLYHYLSERMYYYYNRHISARMLFSTYLLYDLVLFLLVVWLTNVVRNA